MSETPLTIENIRVPVNKRLLVLSFTTGVALFGVQVILYLFFFLFWLISNATQPEQTDSLLSVLFIPNILFAITGFVFNILALAAIVTGIIGIARGYRVPLNIIAVATSAAAFVVNILAFIGAGSVIGS